MKSCLKEILKAKKTETFRVVKETELMDILFNVRKIAKIERM